MYLSCFYNRIFAPHGWIIFGMRKGQIEKYLFRFDQTVLNTRLHLTFLLVSQFGSSFSFTLSSTSVCPLGDFSPSPTQQMVKVEHLTGLCCTSNCGCLGCLKSRINVKHIDVTSGSKTKNFQSQCFLYIHYVHHYQVIS